MGAMETTKGKVEVPTAKHQSKTSGWLPELVAAYPDNIVVQHIIAPIVSHIYL